VAFYTYSVNAPAIVKTAIGEDGAKAATWVNLFGLILLMLLQPLGGPSVTGSDANRCCLLRGRWGALHLGADHLPATDQLSGLGLPVDGRRLRDPHRLHLGERHFKA
jgi:hypothetical protein